MRKSSLFVLVFGAMMLAMSAAIAHAQSNSNPATSFHQLVMPEKPLIVTTAPYRAKLKR